MALAAADSKYKDLYPKSFIVDDEDRYEVLIKRTGEYYDDDKLEESSNILYKNFLLFLEKYNERKGTIFYDFVMDDKFEIEKDEREYYLKIYDTHNIKIWMLIRILLFARVPVDKFNDGSIKVENLSWFDDGWRFFKWLTGKNNPEIIQSKNEYELKEDVNMYTFIENPIEGVKYNDTFFLYSENKKIYELRKIPNLSKFIDRFSSIIIKRSLELGLKPPIPNYLEDNKLWIAIQFLIINSDYKTVYRNLLNKSDDEISEYVEHITWDRYVFDSFVKWIMIGKSEGYMETNWSKPYILTPDALEKLEGGSTKRIKHYKIHYTHI